MSILTRALVLSAAALWTHGGSLAAQVFIEEDEEFSNSAFVRTSEEARADLFFGDLKAGEELWAEAAQAYQRVLDRLDRLDREDDGVVTLGARVLVSAGEAARRRIEAMPPEGLARYRALFAEKASAAHAYALARFDPERLLRVAQRYPASESSEAALRDAAALAHEQGEPLLVTRAVERLLASERATAVDVARYAFALADVAEYDDLARLRGRIRALADEIVDRGGAAISVGALIDELLAGSRRNEDAAAAALASGKLDIDLVQRFPFEERRLLFAPADPLGYVPTTFPPIGGRIVDGTVWAIGLLGVYRLHPGQDPSTPLVRYDQRFEFESESRQLAGRSLEPIARDGRLFFTIVERSTSFYGAGDDSSQLVGIDARADGKTVLRVQPELFSTPSELRDYVFEGPPVIHRDRLIVVGSRLGTTTECSLFAFDVKSGALRWSRFLASAERIARYDARNQRTEIERAVPSAVTLADGVVYVVTNLGIAAAVDAETGSIQWLFKYGRVRLNDSDRYERFGFYDSGGWYAVAPVVFRDRLIITPEDSRFLYVLARRPSADGLLRLNAPTFKRDLEVLIGIDEEKERMILIRQEVVKALRLRLQVVAHDFDGAEIWNSTPLEIEERITGRPLMLARSLFLPTNKALYRFDLDREGQAVDFVPVPEAQLRAGDPYVFGNLSYQDGEILSVSPSMVLRIRPAP